MRQRVYLRSPGHVIGCSEDGIAVDLASLLIQLKGMLPDPDGNWKQIVDVLGKHRKLAEYEVARFYVADTLRSRVDGMIADVDPRRRLAGLEMAQVAFPRPRIARVVRHLVKDADPKVRSLARNLVISSMFTDKALPDTRFAAPKKPETAGLLYPGGWNPTGWLFTNTKVVAGKKKAPKKDKPSIPKLADPAAVATLVGYPSEKQLVALMRPGTASGSAYVEFEIDKATGGKRTICAPRAKLKKVQRKILDEILSHVPTHDAVHGFVKGRSVLSNAKPHQGAAIVVKIDIRDFFPSVHYRRVLGLFESLGYNSNVASTLAGLTTHRPKLPDGTVVWPGQLPQGAPTSPAIANLVCRHLDSRLAGLAQKMGAVYTRYADDLTFSFKAEPEKGLGRFFWWVDQICQQEGFVEKAVKRRVLRTSNQQRITGVVVNSGMFVPREDRRRFRAILENCRRHGVESQARGRKDFGSYLRGYASYVKMVQPDLGKRLLEEVREILTMAKQPAP